ncbi:MAG: RNA polymerase sigma factor [Verrucomicrobiae bacterium]|nr:RNA polymerase sigma factor [Verrucomicrobiae bacterium]
MISDWIEQLRDFYETHREELYGYALAMTRDRHAAEDAIHAAFHRLLRRGRSPAELRPYVFRCVRNAVIDERRRATARAESVLEGEATGPCPGGARAGDLDAMLGQLSDDERETIVLKVLDSLTFREIAEARRVPLHTAASWYRRGMEKLRARLAKEES